MVFQADGIKLEINNRDNGKIYKQVEIKQSTSKQSKSLRGSLKESKNVYN